MKKLFLLSVTSCFAAVAIAQQSNDQSAGLKDLQGEKYRISKELVRDYSSSAKGAAKGTETLGGTRWYDPYQVVDRYLGGTGNTLTQNSFVFPIGYDTTYRQYFTQSGWKPVNWVGVAQFIDPIRSTGFNTGTTAGGFFADNEPRINVWNSYSIDSVVIVGAYVIGEGQNTTPPKVDANAVDSFIISVAPVPYDIVNITQSSGTYKGKVTDYEKVEQNGGVLQIQRGLALNATSRGLNYPGVKTVTVPIDKSLRSAPTVTNGSKTFQTQAFEFEIPGGVTIPAGSAFAISFVFKPGVGNQSGQITPAEQDSVQFYHHFMPRASSAEPSASDKPMRYFGYTYQDFSMTSLLHYQGTSYSPAIILELVNGPDNYNNEYLRILGRATCATCNLLSVGSANTISNVKAYPNPASTEVRIPFELAGNSNVKVSLTNSVGQIVKSMDMGKTNGGEAVFTTSDLASGVYFYTVEADGQRSTGRIAVSH